MTQPLSYLKETASQTAGPYVHIGLSPHQAGFDIFQTNFDNILVGATTSGIPILIEGRVIDGSGHPVRDALLEIWQANADGRYNHPGDRQKTGTVDKDFRDVPARISTRASIVSPRSSQGQFWAARAAEWRRM